MPIIKTNSGHLWQVDSDGQGETVLFIHGWAVDSRIWLQQRSFFVPEFKVLFVDLPGHGQTPWQDLSIEEIAQDIVEICQKSEVERMHVVGSSFGGLVGIKLLEVVPQRIRSLTLVGSQPKFLQTPEYPWGLAPERIEKLRQQLETDYPGIVPIFFRSLFTAKERAGERFKWLQGFRQSESLPDKAALLRLLDVLSQADLRQVLYQARGPLMFLNGTADPICPQAVYAHLNEVCPSARFEWFPGCGHFPFVSQPAEFNRILKDFIETCQP